MAGRPLKYKTAEALQEAINDYFKLCDGEVLRDDEGEPFLDKYGQPVVVNRRPPTVSGLAYALGFNSRQALINYECRKQFHDTIRRAKLFIESYVEGRLFDKDGVQGAKFSLVNNFAGWVDHPKDDPAAEALKKLDDLLRGIDDAAK